MEAITKEIKSPVEKDLVIKDKPSTGNRNNRKVRSDTNTGKKVKVTRDRPVKSILKAITWRIVASSVTFLLAYFVFHNDPYAVQKATGIAIAESVLKIVFYYFHERMWERLRWGRMMVVIRRGTRKSRRSLQRIILGK